MIPKAVQLPRVTYTDKFDSVVLQIPCNPENAFEYYECTLDRHSARKLGLDLMIDAERAQEWVEARKRAAAQN